MSATYCGASKSELSLIARWRSLDSEQSPYGGASLAASVETYKPLGSYSSGLGALAASAASGGGQGVELYLHQQAVDSTTATGKAMLAMCGVFAEFERSVIVERINAGLHRTRAQGKGLGRPPVAAKVEVAIRTKAR
jgi:Resolvase, N terminal domain